MPVAQPPIKQSFEDVTLEERPEQTSKEEFSTIASEHVEADRAWRSHPVNIRVSIPFFFGRWYFTLVGGPERRDSARRKTERQKHPLLTLGNATFLFLVGSVIGVAVAVLMINGAVELLDGSHTVITK